MDTNYKHAIMPAKIAKEDLLADISRVADELEKEPSKADYNEHGEYSTYPAKTKFGTWTDAKEAAGVDLNRENEYVPKGDVLDDLKRVAEVVDGPISKQVYNEHGEYHTATLFKRCGSILEALDELGITHRVGKAPNGIDKERVLDDIRDVAETVGHAPSRNEYSEHGKFSEILPRIKFGSWSKAREAAGIDGGPTKNTRIPKEEIEPQLRELAEILGRAPAQTEFDEWAEVSYRTVIERYGSWNEAMESIGVDPNSRHDTIEEMVAEIQRLESRLGSVPSQRDMQECGKYGVTTYQRNFGSWANAVEMAELDPLSVGAPSGERNPSWKDEPTYQNYTHPLWKENRPKAMERDSGVCQHPGCDLTREKHHELFDMDLIMHHVDRTHWPKNKEKFHRLGNLVTICVRHHHVWEGTGLHPQEKA